MSSIISHVYITNKVKEYFNLSNNDILYGSILPDILTLQGSINKTETHYLKEFKLNGNLGNYPDIKLYIEQHKNTLIKDQIQQGYLSHLIEDQLWFSKYIPEICAKRKDNYVIYNKDHSLHSEESFSNDIYGDYPIMDRYLLKFSSINVDKLKMEFLNITKNNNIKLDIINKFRLYDLTQKKLKLMSIDLVNRYIEEAFYNVTSILNNFYK